MFSSKLVIATHNAHKLHEIATILQQNIGRLPFDIVSAGSLLVSDPVEDGGTFKENALLKAHHVFSATGFPALADDSGLVVDVLGNAPGILSARWSGKHGDNNANNALLLAQLDGLPDKLRRARFITACALVYRGANGEVNECVTTGEMHGQIAREMRGTGGFGYDSMFIADDANQLVSEASTKLSLRTNAELTAAEKNSISHRAKALRAMACHVEVI